MTIGPLRRRRGTPGPLPVPGGAADPATGRTLWETSEELTRVGYHFG
ncbi:hypothetical protein Misp01_21890 [Microtetraspora sp. NBRC 13810]|nr:hypothetical protein [Microtetraspora sp. NBRC 13810]GLW07059.1 hypothetical protein Misp01_21890 [Microtetraspora sp. NBRC 13810]